MPTPSVPPQPHTTPAASVEPEEVIRTGKVERLRQIGRDPFPAKSHRTHTVSTVLEQFTDLSEAKTPVTITGRVRALRPHGKLTFGTVEDQTGQMQVVWNEQHLGEVYAQLKLVDVADIVECSGTAFTTKTGQQSIEVGEWHILTKVIRPLPSQW